MPAATTTGAPKKSNTPRPLLKKGAKLRYSEEICKKYPLCDEVILTLKFTHHQWAFCKDQYMNDRCVNIDDLQGIDL